MLSLFLGGVASAPGQHGQRHSARRNSNPRISSRSCWRSPRIPGTRYFAAQGGSYREPTLVLFSGRVNSACGMASAAVGPFYCPGDQKLYIDLSFFNDLQQRHGAPGDFAQAYVIAHEVGHHVQTLLGISQQVQEAGRGKSKAQVNALSVRQELQADCLAGVWGSVANRERNWLDPGDLEEALRAATAIGDDRLQQRGRRRGGARQLYPWLLGPAGGLVPAGL